MPSSFINFLKSFFVFCTILSLPVFYVSFFVHGQFISPLIPAQFIFFIITTGILHYLLLKSMKKKQHLFVVYYMGIAGLKMFLYLIIIITCFFMYKSQAKSFVISFLSFYIFFTIFEVISILKSSKSQTSLNAN